MSTHDDRAEAPTGRLARVQNSVFRMTPVGDAVRGWGALGFAIAAYCAVFLSSPADGGDFLLRMLAAVDAFYVLYLVSTWIAMYRSSSADARHWALAQEGHSRRTRFLETLKGTRLFSGGGGLFTIVSFSLVGLLFALLLLPGASGAGNDLARMILCVLGVVTAWALLHTSFALYYAHLYYRGQSPGGLHFPGEDQPDPLDFAYFAFTVGISFAASDVAITQREMRRTTLFHGILAFFYNTAILALVINIVLTQAG